MSGVNLFTMTPAAKSHDCLKPPLLTGNRKEDVLLLRRYDKKTLLALCENDKYVFQLCNDDFQLNRIITAPDFLH